jgi:hypothetical protein
MTRHVGVEGCDGSWGREKLTVGQKRALLIVERLIEAEWRAMDERAADKQGDELSWKSRFCKEISGKLAGVKPSTTFLRRFFLGSATRQKTFDSVMVTVQRKSLKYRRRVVGAKRQQRIILTSDANLHGISELQVRFSDGKSRSFESSIGI